MSAESADLVALRRLCAVASLRAGGGSATRTPVPSLRSAAPAGAACRLTPSPLGGRGFSPLSAYAFAPRGGPWPGPPVGLTPSLRAATVAEVICLVRALWLG